PLAVAGSAAAATTAPQQADLPTLGLPNAALPLGLPDSLGSLTAGLPVAHALPVDDAVNGLMPPLGQIMQVGDLGLLPQRPAVAGPAIRSAMPDAAGLSDAANRMLSGSAAQAVSRLTSALPLANVVPQLASAGDGPLQLAPNVLRQGALATLADNVAPQSDALTGGLVGQTQPLVSQLHTRGVPTVGELTNNVSSTNLPVVGTVGSLTQTLPVSSVLGSTGPVTGALQNVSGL
ncbi:MAG: hypothetical protein ACRDVE_15370, partial [Actinocrinis sp.]